jgi:demethylmenaquinone methyltransferase/2-methoxy-6-polyprenyl-1,4-benzoquinol methylase
VSNFDHFEILAPLYEVFIPPRMPDKIKELAQLPTDGALLDAGGGTGRIAQFLRGLAQLVVVTDVSRQMLQQAMKKDGLHSICSHVEKLPFTDGAFARIVMIDALHHVYDQHQTTKELWRVLKPNGRIVIEEPDIRTTGVKLLAIAEKLALMRSHFLSPPEIASLFSYPDADVRIEAEKGNAWVIIERRA